MIVTIDYFQTFDWNEASLRWAVAWFLACCATAINLKKDIRGMRITRADPHAEPSVLASAEWFVRQNLLKWVACVFMVIAGVNSITRGSVDGTRVLLELAAYVICINQVWNMADHWRIEKLLLQEKLRENERTKKEGD